MIRLLIHRFLARTGVPMVLNNFFNENEPIVCTCLAGP
jgi:predicted NodU family carbamoyl transferase